MGNVKIACERRDVFRHASSVIGSRTRFVRLRAASFGGRWAVEGGISDRIAGGSVEDGELLRVPRLTGEAPVETCQLSGSCVLFKENWRDETATVALFRDV